MFVLFSALAAVSLSSVAGGTPVPVTEAPAPRASLRAVSVFTDGVRTGGAPSASAAALLAEGALDALTPHVEQQSHPEALRRAFHAYYAYRTSHPERVRKPYLYYVDYGLDSHTPRGYVFDMERLELVDGPFTVAHGRGSASGAAGVPTRFSNTRDSAMSSLGLYLTQETYAFSGRSGGRRYRSVGLRMQGLSGRFNSAARARGIVAHGAPYVTPSRAGRSEGCPAVEESRAQRLLPRIANGSLVFLFSPVDPAWLRDDPWGGTLAGATNTATGPALAER